MKRILFCFLLLATVAFGADRADTGVLDIPTNGVGVNWYSGVYSGASLDGIYIDTLFTNTTVTCMVYVATDIAPTNPLYQVFYSNAAVSADVAVRPRQNAFHALATGAVLATNFWLEPYRIRAARIRVNAGSCTITNLTQLKVILTFSE